MDIMIDLETMGLGPTPAIVQIGAVLFSPHDDKIYGRRSWGVSLQSSLLAGGKIDSSTVDWWRQQSPQAQKAICRKPIGLEQALEMFEKFYHSLGKIDHIWSHGAASDVPWLEAAFLSVGKKAPWRHTEVRDTRTLFWMAKMSGWEKPMMEGVAHDAMADAEAQALDVRSAFRWIQVHGIANNPNLPEG